MFVMKVCLLFSQVFHEFSLYKVEVVIIRQLQSSVHLPPRNLSLFRNFECYLQLEPQKHDIIINDYFLMHYTKN